MKKTKKLISILLSVLMLFSITAGIDFSAYAATSGDFEYSVSGSYATITDYTGSATSVTIPSTIDGYTVTRIGQSVFQDCTSLKSVTIPDSVTSIGSSAFNFCTSLTNVTIPDSVTSIGSSAFNLCTSLTNVTIPNSVTSIGSSAFGYCQSLTSVTIPDSVTSIGDSTFYACTRLTSVTIPDGVTSIGISAFDYCKSLISVTIPNSVTSIGASAFQDCKSLISVTIPNSVTRIGDRTFYDCSSLTNVTIPDSVTSIRDYAFRNCTSLTSVTIPSSVTSIGDYAFEDCTSLTSVTIPDSVTSIGSSAFEDCTSLTSVTIPNSVTSIGSSAFYRVNNIVYNGSATGSPWGAKIVNGYVDGYLVYKDDTKQELLLCLTQATSVTIPNSVTSIGESAFEDCKSLISVTIPNSVTSIGKRAFYNCRGLTSVTIPDSVASIGSSAFYRVNNIVYNGSASGSPWGAKSVNGYVDGYLVYKDSTKKELLGCSSQATSVTIPNSVTSIGNYAFEDCTSLTSVTIPNSVTSIGSSAFYRVTNIEYHGSATGSPWGAKIVNGYVDGYLVYKDSTKKELLCCSSQAISVTIPDSVTSIGDDAFRYCSSLTNVTIGNSVTSIGYSAFYYCTSLTSVTIPNSVTIIDMDAFYNCSKLRYIFYSGSQNEWKNISIGSNNSNLTNAKIHYNSTYHTSSNETITKQANCIENGIITGVCTICNESYTKVIPAFGHNYSYGSTVPPTCSSSGYDNYVCSRCSSVERRNYVNPLEHTVHSYEPFNIYCHYGVCEVCDTSVYDEHIFDGDTCTVCGYKPADTTAYDDALAEANAIMGASDYTTKYLESSRTAYENAVNAAIRDDFLTQEEADSAASAIISAKSLLTYSQSTVEFYIVDESGNITNQISETVSYGDVLTLNAGDYISDSDQITKWVAISGANSYESKVATSQRSYTMVVTKPVKVYAHYVTISSEPTVKYSRITFISKNGAVVDVKYLKQGETLDTSTVEAPVIPFYEFVGWNKASVTANGSDIFVKAMYEFIEVEENRCNVHYDSSVKSYAYDSFVYIYGAENKKLALSTDGTQAGIITYLEENAFYAPRCSDIYVIEVEQQQASIGITGSYSVLTDEYKTAAFNCKYFVPDGCTVVEYGLIASSEKGVIKVAGQKSSARGEYCIKLKMTNTSSISLVYGKAYLTYKAPDGELVTIYSSQVSQSL